MKENLPYLDKRTIGDPKKQIDSFGKMMAGDFDDIPTKQRPTPIDFNFTVLPDMEGKTEEKVFLDWIEKVLDIKSELILKEGKSKESEEVFTRLNKAFNQSFDFMENVLLYSERDLFVNVEDFPKSISSKEDIFYILRNTQKAKKENGNKHALAKSLVFCRLVKVMIAIYETLKNEANELNKAKDLFESKMISDNKVDSPLISISTDGKGDKLFFLREFGDKKGKINSRAKDFEKVILRFINRPEANIQEALKDGVGFKLSIEQEDIPVISEVLIGWLINQMHVENVLFEDINLLSSDDLKNINKNINKNKNKKFSKKIKIKSTIDKKVEKNATSQGEYKAIVITGIVSAKNLGGGLKKDKRFEIQIVTPDNKNNKKGMNHAIYDLAKKVSARTRLDGGCPANVYEKFIQEASVESGMSVNNVKECIKGIIKIKVKHKKPYFYYISEDIYKRKNNFGFVDDFFLK
ncbi:MAG: hypothetical protein K9L98_01590 [Candidatus Pacebacteria bacterium]|nr:hypothetical protein [Candidatus Paceibacterota bacterium]MCF7862686.1 hypothetical protein [Candidatus Paceibacterota bacterium]